MAREVTIEWCPSAADELRSSWVRVRMKGYMGFFQLIDARIALGAWLVVCAIGIPTAFGNVGVAGTLTTLPVFLAVGLLFYRMQAGGLYLSSAGVVVKHFFRNYRMPWSKVRSFELAPASTWFLDNGWEWLVVRLEDGTHLHVKEMRRPTSDAKRVGKAAREVNDEEWLSLDSLVLQLNDILVARRQP